MYKALSVAHYVIERCNNQNMGISNLKLQKLLYFIQAEFLVSTPNNAPCFEDTIEAWDFGPVIPTVYHHYKIYGSSIIPSNDNDPLGPFYENIAVSDQDIINRVIDETIGYTAFQLVEITHQQAPWKNAYMHGYNNVISNDSILAYFKE